MYIRRSLLQILSIIVVLSMIFSDFQVPVVSAQETDGIKRQHNAQTGKVSFIGSESGRVLSAAKALGITSSARPTDPGMALAKRFGPEFGLKDPVSELTRSKIKHSDTDRVAIRYQQNYQGVPVIGGELIVNTNRNGDLYSISGEISADLSLSTQPTIDAERARQTALQGAVKWYKKNSEDFRASTPELWIYDESLLRPSTHPRELVWRMEIMPKEPGMPVRELVLVNAQSGAISLHFNQVDTSWTSTRAQDPAPTEPPTPTETPLPTDEVVATETTVPTEAAPVGTPVPTKIAPPAEPTRSAEAARLDKRALAFNGTTRYVASTGTDSGTCTSSGSPCAQIQYAINQSASGDIIKVADGIYVHTSINVDPNVVILNKGVLLSGGWQSDFSSQTGASTIDGQNVNNGILVTAASAAAVDRFIIQNSKSSDSGAIYHLGTSLILQNSTLRNNTATNRGAGIFVTGTGALTVVNSTISNNISASSGGGIFVNSGTVDVEYSTIAYNTSTAGTGGGVFRGSGTLHIHNSILANNNGAISPNCNSLNTSDYNVIGSTTGCTFTIGIYDQTAVNPKINNTLSGVMPVHELLSGSPAIDAGNLTSCNSNTGNHDERGVIRPQGTGCDIGAVEYTFAGLVVVSGSGQNVFLGSAFALPFTARLLDDSQNPVSGVKVTFSAPPSGASGTFANGANSIIVTTDSDGLASSSIFTANAVGGSYTVSASAEGYFGSVKFNLVNQTVLFVATTGSDSNACTDPALPCLTINGAVGKATAGDTIKVAIGTYTGSGSQVVLLNKNVLLSGGWDAAFVTQTEWSMLDGQDVRTVVVIGDANSAIMERFVIQNGAGYSSGGITNNGGLILNNSVVRNNRCWGSGGCGGGIANDEALTLNNSTVRGNTSANFGGGIFNSTFGTLTVNNSTISENAAGSGGGLYSYKTVALNNSTISSNKATNTGGGIYYFGSRYGGTFTLQNTIVAGNSAGGGPDCSGPVGSAGYNLIGNNSGCTFGTITGDLVGTSSNPIDARLAPLPDNGKSVFTHALMPSSPAINAGNPAVPGSGGHACLATDQRGIGRPADIRCDIGAFEYTGTGTIAAYLAAYSGMSQYVGINSSAVSTLKVVVLDADGNTVAGQPVIFTAPESGPSVVFASTGTNISTATTDVNGMATSSAFSANEVTGKYIIQASVDGVEDSADFQITNGAQVKTYTANNNRTVKLPGTFLCDQRTPGCTNGSNPHADSAQKFAIGAYVFYLDMHGRYGIDDNNMPIVSTVQYCDPDTYYPCPYDNAFWDGKQMLYGSKYGFALADDVVVHELTHGVTDYESDLYYYYQSGAISESFSDLWGEYYDQINGVDITSGGRWNIGEDVYGMSSPMRSMRDPTFYKDPATMSSTYYYTGSDDNGGVHTNSGINNEAVFLMVDGGNLGTKTVTALGWEKTAAIYYEVNTNLLTSGADYSDLYYALQQACSNLIGQKGITAGDCGEVKDAIDAVEMNSQPVQGFNTHAPYCNSNDFIAPVFSDDLESGISNWTFANGTRVRWQLDSPYGSYAHSGLHSLYADDYPAQVANASARLRAVNIPANAYLHFAQAYGFETDLPDYYDGGVLEYSINNGITWINADSLIDSNGYDATIYVGAGNPLSGKRAFAGDSHGYISTRVNLTSLAGKTVTFRWRMGLDEAGYTEGWWLDDIEIYQCVAPDLLAPGEVMNLTAIPASSEGVVNLSWTAPADDAGVNASGPVKAYQVKYSTSSFTNWEEGILVTAGLPVPTAPGAPQTMSVSGLTPGTLYYFAVRTQDDQSNFSNYVSVSSIGGFIPAAALSAPSLTSPTNRVTLNDTTPLLDWRDHPSAIARYRMQVATVNTFNSPLYDESTTASEFEIPSDLAPGMTYYWRVSTYDFADQISKWSLIYSFTLDTTGPTAPTLRSPGDAATVRNVPIFRWNAVGDAVLYEFQLDNDSDFSSPLVSVEQRTPSRKPAGGLRGTYSWRVRARDAAGNWGAWSSVFTVTITSSRRSR